MSEKKYINKNCDLDSLLKEIEVWFSKQDYQTQSHISNETWLLQAAKTETWRKVIGASRAFNVTIQGTANDFSVELSTGEWASNLAVGGIAAVLTGGATLFVSGVTAGWSKKIEIDLWNFIDQRINFGEKSKSDHVRGFSKAQSAVESKIKKLKEAYDQGLIDEAVYNSKRIELESSVQSAKQTAEVQEKLDKLQDLLKAGILTQGEYDTKKAELGANSVNSELEAKISQLDSALSVGIITQEEYNRKRNELEKEFKLASKLKQLEKAKEAGIITEDEFEEKKKTLTTTVTS